jgi:trk system potassium uptake protein TrkH
VRIDRKLIDHYKAAFSYTGFILFLVGLLILTPLLTLITRHDECKHSPGFLIPAFVLIVLGICLWKFLRKPKPEILTINEGGIIVLFSWVITFIFSALPFMFILKLNFTKALFESVSGWTTTGLSVVDVTTAPYVILLWRSIMQLAGGAGLAIIMLTAIAGPAGPGFSIAEGRGEQLVPHVRQSAKLVMSIYFGYIVVGIGAYYVSGMTLFDAINHAFAALSTGGFSTHQESIGYWHKASIEAITIVLMIFGNLNFLTAYLLFHGKFKAISRNGEIRLMMIAIPVSFLILLLIVTQTLYSPITKSIRVAIFESVSALTTTGFSTVGYNDWSSFGYLVLIILMLIGGGTCSTAGGIKQYRIYLLYKSLIWEIRRAFFPRTAIIENYIWQREQKDFISDQRLRQIAVFLFLYIATYFIGSGMLAAHGYELKDSLFEFASSLGTVGLSIGITAPSASPLVLWTEILGMFLGRLEFFIIIISIGKIARDLFQLIKK